MHHEFQPWSRRGFALDSGVASPAPGLGGALRSALGRLLSSLLLGCALLPVAAAHAPHDVVQALGVSPAFAQDQTLLAACTLEDRKLLARSTDGGKSFSLGGWLVGTQVITGFAFSKDFASNGQVFASTQLNGVYRSDDGGVSWNPTSPLPWAGEVSSVAVSPAASGAGLLLAAGSGGLARSSDGGQSWSAVGPLGEPARVVAFSLDGTAFAGGTSLLRSLDGGLTWSALAALPAAVTTLAVSPSHASGRVLAAGFGPDLGVWFSLNRGVSFVPGLEGLTELDVNHVAFAPGGSVYAATRSAGCFAASAPLQPWTLGTEGLEALSDLVSNHFNVVAPSPAFLSDQTVFLGAYEGLFTSLTAASSWTQSYILGQRLNRWVTIAPGSEGKRTLVLGNYGGGLLFVDEGGPKLPGTQGGPATQSSSGVLLKDSTAPPDDVLQGAPGLAPLQPASVAATGYGLDTLFSGSFALSPRWPTDPTVYYGHTFLYRSNDGGLTWTKLPHPGAIDVVRTIALSPLFPDDPSVFVGSPGKGAFRSLDGGQTWISLLGSGMPEGTSVAQIALSPAYPGVPLVVCAVKARNSTEPGAYRSLDGGASFTSMGLMGLGGLRTLELSPDHPADGTLLAGTLSQGLWISTDDGASFSPAGLGTPAGEPVAVEAVGFSPDFAHDRTVFVATLSHGVFRSTDGASSFAPVGPGLPGSPARHLSVSPRYRFDRTLLLSTYDWTHISRNGGDSWHSLPRWVRVDEKFQSVVEAGTWVHATDPAGALKSFGPGQRASSSSGSSATFRFTGKSITWHASRGPDAGLARVVLDGVPVVVVDLYAPAVEQRVEAWTHSFEAAGIHEVRISVLGLAHPSSSGKLVRNDGFSLTW